MNLSYWEWNSYFKNIDVAIIGSGIVGLSAAIHIKTSQPKLNVIVVERGILPSGASTRNAGFACFGSVSELLDDLSHQPEAVVFELLEKRWKGLQKMKKFLGVENIEYQALGAYELFTQNASNNQSTQKDEASFENSASQINYLNSMIKQITGEAETFSIRDEAIQTLGFHQIKHLIYNRSEGQINTGAMMKTLIQKVKDIGIEILNGITIAEILEKTNCVELQTTNNWTIKATKVLVATNGFTQQLLPEVNLQSARNQVLITKPIPDLKLKGCFHYNKGYVYFRNIHNRILLGGGRNINLEIEQTEAFGITETIQNYLTQLLSTHFLPNQSFEIDRWWSGILGVGVVGVDSGKSKTPIVKKVSDRIAVSVRLGGMGVAIGMLVGEEGGQLLLES